MRSFARLGSVVTLVVGITTCASVQLRAQETPLASSRVAATTTSSASSDAGVELRDWFGARPWSEWSTATGDWNSARSWLIEQGLDVALSETADVSSVRPADGRRVIARGLFNVSVAADANALRVPGSGAFVELQWLPGTNGADVMPTRQGFSNIDAGDVPFVGELWYEQRLGRLRAKVGRVDANSEFAFVNAGSDFLIPAMGFSPSIVAMTTYPTPASSVSLFVEALPGVDVGGGLFNGSPGDGRWFGWDSRFAIAQVGTAWTIGGTGLAGTATSGGWRFSDSTGAAADTSGFYLTAEQMLWADAERGTSAFVQFGSSDEQSAVRRHVGAGLSTRGLSRRRPLDVTGVGATWIRFAGDASVEESDLALELFHRLVLTPSISVIPDVQVLRAPDGDATGGRSAAFTCRIRLDF
jgi:porin